MSFRVDSAGRSDVGLVREKNEDSFVVDPDLGLYVVCDGMGGHVGGQVASQTSVAKITEVVRNGLVIEDGQADRLASAIRLANLAVFQRARAEPALHNMGTTVVAIREDGDLLHLCHVGDSRIYRVRSGALDQVTMDHSLVNLYASNPELAKRFGPANENVIVRAVGLREEVEVDHRAIAMEEGDMYLLCSDGLTDMVDDWILKELLEDGLHGSIDECADALIRAALGNGGVDNVTAVVLRITGAH
ncbi:MAG: serine/threonine-protein phosphatase [Myxococcales bacterium]|nr:serine/threonine-protein phosphatase [Myxococcales bacterium]